MFASLRFKAVASVALTLLVSTSMSWCAAKDKNDDSSVGRAGNWKKAGQGAPALEACKKKAAEHPNDAEAQNDLGWALRQNGDLKTAEATLRTSIKLNDASPYPHSNLSVVLLDEDKPEDALVEARKAVSLNGKEPIFHAVLANALDANADKKGAIEEYRVALKLRPDYENAMYNLGRCLNEDGQLSEAKLTLSEALELDPNDDRVMKLLDKILQ
jgi:Flp pilus assembly protein TadD